MNRIGLEQLSVLGMPPVPFVHLAADLGCAHISVSPTQRAFNPYNYPAWSLHDPTQRKAMNAALAERQISVALGEGLAILPDVSVRGMQGVLDILVDLGARNLNLYSLDPDIARSRDEIAIFAEMAAGYGADVLLEFSPNNCNRNFTMAVETVKHTGRANVGIILDTMHFFRTGGTPADLKAADLSMIRHVQICDTFMRPNDNYAKEAISERFAPGDGELPLQETLAILPQHLVLGLEMPRAADATAGKDPHDYLGRALDRVRAILPPAR
jgi:sugar phosphate isomerase/epimerase